MPDASVARPYICGEIIKTRYQKAIQALKVRYRDWLEQRYLRQLAKPNALTFVAQSEALGRSVFARRAIVAGTLLGVYPGQKRSGAELLAKQEFINRLMSFSYCLDDGTVIDPTDLFGHVANKDHLHLALINEPPLGAKVNVLPINSRAHVWYVVLSDVAAGEELFTSYGTKYQRNYPSEMTQTKGKVELSSVDRKLLQEVAKRYPWLQIS